MVPIDSPWLVSYSTSIVGIGIFDLFCSCDLDLDPITFKYELHPYSMEICRMYKCELPTSRLSKVIVLSLIHI